MLSTVFYSALAATTTALVAYLSRSRRIPRLSHVFIRGVRGAKTLVWENPGVVIAVAILAGLTVNGWQAHQIMQITASTRGALCSYRADLIDRMEANQSQLAHPDIFGLTPIAVQSLGLTVQNQRRAIYSLRRLGC
jgi:hypothetical protein